MVKGVEKLRARLAAVPKRVRVEVKAQIEKEARKLVRQMEVLNPLPENIKIGWTWGKEPAGALKIGSTRGGKYGKIAATIYATGKTEDFPGGFPAIARWFEFGTAPRTVKKTGQAVGRIAEQPYFYPAFRANRTNIKSNISRAVTRGFKKSAGTGKGKA